MTPIILCGSSGRMGQAIMRLAAEQNFSIVAQVSRTALGADIYPNLAEALAAHSSAVIVDFSHAELLPMHLDAALKHKASLLLATTGHSDENYVLIEQASKTIPILVAPNTSPMAAIMLSMAELAARALKADIEILEIHHKKKKDAPSGTALALKKALSLASGSTINVQSMRVGDVTGEHTAYFFSNFEQLELTHRVSDRRVFAQGALLAAQFLFDRAPGLYGMADVLKIMAT